MRTLSWLFGSMSAAFLVAGCLLLLQPNTAHAGVISNCSDCNCCCAINNGNPAGCPGLGCGGVVTCAGGGTAGPCSGTFGASCDCSVSGIFCVCS